MRDLSITEFRRQCLSLLDALPDEGIMVTKRGTPLARIMPAHKPRRGERVKLPLLGEKANPGRFALTPKLPTTSYLIDVNVWLAMTWDLHPQHAAASRWYAAAGKSNDATFLFCRFTMLGLLRLLTNRAAMGDGVVTIGDALRLYDNWTSDPRVELATEPRGLDKPFRRALSPVTTQSATKAIADCYLTGFAASAGTHLVTLDKALAALTRSQQVPATLIRASHAH